SDPAQPARAAVIINSIIVEASNRCIGLMTRCSRYIPSPKCGKNGSLRPIYYFLIRELIGILEVRWEKGRPKPPQPPVFRV
mgnify:CR=1